jgi:DNA-binding response OmpR family regulator
MDNHGEIMIVDDTPVNLQLLAGLLEDEGYSVRPTRVPEMAVESALANPPDLILLDIKMPGMDGFEVCQKLKQHKQTADVPVIFISALQETQDRSRGFEVGGVDFITKPILREEVLARVSDQIELYQMRNKDKVL